MAGQHQIWAYAFEETQWWNDMYVYTISGTIKRVFTLFFIVIELYKKIPV
jgi:hypothetical protein